MKIFLLLISFFFFFLRIHAQQKLDTTILVGKNFITLSEVVINNKLDVHDFINRIKSDTSFYKAFKNLRTLQFTSINDIRMNNRKGQAMATMHSKTRQLRKNNCRTMQTIEEQTTGNFYNENHQYNYYTAQLYASLFFTTGSICGENNIVKGSELVAPGTTSIERHKNQLKMLFFNPGKKISGIPFISSKTAIFDDDMITKYNIDITMAVRNNINCYVYKQTVKPIFKNEVVIDSMVTWFNEKTYEVVARDYNLNYNAGPYNFNVQMQVEIAKFGVLNVPNLIRYTGDWKIIFKPKETGVFTATLFDFKN